MNDLKIHVSELDNPYGEVIQRALAREFPGSNRGDKATTLELVAAEIIGTNQSRFGPAPNPESLVAIRAVLRKHIEEGSPIPFLVPWGSKKPINGESVDVAELMGLKTLQCLQGRVRRYYEPGLRMNMRIEDVGGKYLFKSEGDAALRSSETYVRDFLALVDVLNFRFLRPVLESALMDPKEYDFQAGTLAPVFQLYLERTDLYGIQPGPSELTDIGWQGLIPQEQRDFYRHQYAKWFPGMPIKEQTWKLAEYLAGALARHKLRGTGAEPEWGRDFIQLNFAQPAPGTPQGIAERRIHYRTVPLRFAATHVPPWRAKGYLKVGDSEAYPKITSWYESGTYNQCSVEFSRAGASVSVRSDYKV
jgi:hypothetical protein